MKALVGNDEQGVHIFLEAVDAFVGGIGSALALEGEGPGDDAHGESAGFPCNLGDDGSRAGAGSAAHTGGDEDHIGFPNDIVEFFAAFFGGLHAEFGVAAYALACGQPVADTHFERHIAGNERLGVSVDNHVFDRGYALAEHARDGV